MLPNPLSNVVPYLISKPATRAKLGIFVILPPAWAHVSKSIIKSIEREAERLDAGLGPVHNSRYFAAGRVDKDVHLIEVAMCENQRIIARWQQGQNLLDFGHMVLKSMR
ncbi:hypothetical protein BM221_001614 [Beauveria bassiana]|uniref:Uncharacterized protein n=1 Tax=Beauveria bassiana TaxID=176275 RepID=A0A2N6NW79_BEABA|nr:hypothetical protein BM221_001614 [Beauveria bassiana]